MPCRSLAALAAAAVAACGDAPVPVTAQPAAPACDPGHFHRALDTPFRARVAVAGLPLPVIDRDDTTAELAIERGGALVTTRRPIAQLAPSVIVEAHVSPAPDASVVWPLTVEPGFPIEDTAVPQTGYLRVHSTHDVTFDGWIPADAVGAIWRDEKQPARGSTADPALERGPYQIGYDARAAPLDEQPPFARVDSTVDSVLVDGDPPHSAPQHSHPQHTDAWVRLVATTAWIRLDGWARGPFTFPHRYELTDDRIESDDPRPGPVILAMDTCLYATPDLSGAPIGVVTGALGIDGELPAYGTLRIRIDAPWGRVDAFARDPRRGDRVDRFNPPTTTE